MIIFSTKIILHDVRSFFVDGKVWSVGWKREKEEPCDFRYINQIKGGGILWEEYHLPEEIAQKLSILMKRLGLKIAAPEFLKDQYVLRFKIISK